MNDMTAAEKTKLYWLLLRDPDVERRERLPDDRKAMIWHFTIHTRDAEMVKGYVRTGCYDDGRLGEVFVTMGKIGEASALLDQWCIRVSVELQKGTSVEEICRKHLNTQFDPAGGTDFQEISRCTSVLDLVCKYLMLRYGRTS